MDAGRSLLLVHPVTITLNGVAQSLERLTAGHRAWHHIGLSELVSRPGTLAQRLLDHLGHGHVAEDADMRSLIDHLGNTVLWLVPSETGEEAHELARFFTRFAPLAAQREPHERPLLVCVCTPRALVPMPTSDATLLRLHWWGQIGPLDTLVTVDEMLNLPRVVGDREVIAELAGWDLELAERLALAWQGYPLNSETLLAALPSRRDGEAIVEHARLASASGMTFDPPEELYVAWANGSVNWWGDRALVHISHYLDSGDIDVVNRRIWRGQVAAVLPFAELARERLAHWIAERVHLLHANWRYKNLSALEVGALEKVFAESPELRRSPSHHELARQLRHTRHRLAHLQLVDRERVQRIEQLLRDGLFT
jgi:hypothetical protein